MPPVWIVLNGLFSVSHLKVRADKEDEGGSVVAQKAYDDDEDLETAFGLERFDIFSFASVAAEDRMGRSYTERDFERKRMLQIVVSFFFFNLEIWSNYTL